MDVNVVTWATAISHHSENDRKIIWRFAETFSPGFDPATLPERVIIVWRYASETGMPGTTDHRGMNHLEDLLEPVTDAGRVATLALVSTGENLREWTYYTRSGEEFMERLNLALWQECPFPIEIHGASDPGWSMYKEFRAGLAS